jgi:hypothetical protein
VGKKLDLKDIVLVGRTFNEYYKMFDLKNLDKNEKILDVGSGVSYFCVEAKSLGYDEQLDYDFHKAVINELVRIAAKEIRIFPLVNLSGKKSKFADKLMNDEEFNKYKFEIVKVQYEFVKGGNEMMVIIENK